MLKKPNVFVTVVLVVFLFSSVLMAEEIKPTPPTPMTRKPIVVKWTTVEGVRYYYSGIKVGDSKSLETIISPLNDPEANRLLKVSRDSNSAGVFYIVASLPLIVGGLIWTGVSYNNGVNMDTGGEVGGGVIALVGLVGDYIGVFKIVESKTSQFAAVQRYNAIIHGDDETSW